MSLIPVPSNSALYSPTLIDKEKEDQKRRSTPAEVLNQGQQIQMTSGFGDKPYRKATKNNIKTRQ